MNMVHRPPLARSRRHALLGGVCGGFAEGRGWDPTLVRIGFVVLSCASVAFPGILVYLACWILMPKSEY